ncbi:hypothetical protein D3C85_1096670 [compost metagenome]
MEAIQAALKPSLQMEAIQAALKPSLQMEAIQAALKPTLQMESIRAALTPLPTMAAIHAAIRPMDGVSSILDSIKAFPTMVALGASLAAMGSLSLSPSVDWQTLSSTSLLEAVSTAAQVFQEDGVRENQLTDLITRFSNAANDDGDVDDRGIQAYEIGQQLSAAASTGDITQISDKAKKYMAILFWLISALFTSVAIESAVRTEACQWQPTIWPGMTSGQKGKAIRKAACDVPSEVLKEHRYVNGTGVRLRAVPSTKGEILPVVLYDGDLLEVISTGNRDWLKIAVVGKKDVDGWISRRYVKAIVP